MWGNGWRDDLMVGMDEWMDEMRCYDTKVSSAYKTLGVNGMHLL